jgi:phosphoenolpyruvate---glycerone phosphotransferase subunit DhaL
MNCLNSEQFRALMDDALAAVRARAEEFSSLDAAIGDGDHGTAIVSALAAASGAAGSATDLKTMLNAMGFGAMSESCGSTSTLIGAWLMGMSDGVQTEALDASQVAAMFAAGLANVSRQTKAQVGDKTMLDALIPATNALQTNVDRGIGGMFSAAADAAAAGAANTEQLVARFGRARNLGERTLGHADPGAMSMACIFRAFARSFPSATHHNER